MCVFVLAKNYSSLNFFLSGVLAIYVSMNRVVACLITIIVRESDGRSSILMHTMLHRMFLSLFFSLPFYSVFFELSMVFGWFYRKEKCPKNEKKKN